MNNTALDIIQARSDERQALWRKAGKGGLNKQETERVKALTAELAQLWDQHRREVAGDTRVKNSDYVRGKAA